MTIKQYCMALVLGLLVLNRGVVFAAPASPEAIQKAIEKGVAFLYSTQKNDCWEVSPAREGTDHKWQTYQGDTWGGSTDMAVYALLAAGEKPTDPRLASAIEFIKKSEQIGVYNLAVRCVVWSMLPQTPEIRKLLMRDVASLGAATRTQGVGVGFCGYLPKETGNNYDLSVSQFAVLGVWAAADAGVEISDAYWQTIDAAWRKEQFPDGGWAYARNMPGRADKPTPTMTAAGVATLFITQDHLRLNNGNCKGNPIDKNIELGIAAIERTFNAGMTTPGVPVFPRQYYCMFGYERIGVASGYKYFGKIDWFSQIASTLVAAQKPDGRWATGVWDVANTSFAIISLARGRAPVMINKLRYTNTASESTNKTDKSASERPERWNQRPRDVANFVRWLEKQSEASLNWQILSLDAPVDELHDAPVIYISGDEAPAWSKEQLAKLRNYMEGGGLVLANADCGGAKFTAAIQKAGKELFPGYAWRELPADHPIYTNQLFNRKKWKSKPNVMAISNGARELMMIVPAADLGKAWQTEATTSRPELYELTSNIIRYVGGVEVTRRAKGVVRPTLSTTKPSNTMSVARIQYSGNWNPEPGGWNRLACLMSQQLVGLEIKTIAPTVATPIAGTIAHLTGTDTFKLTAEERTAIQKYVNDGGTLVVDAAGGSSEFATSAETELEAMFPGFAKAVTPLAADHAVFTGAGDTPIKIRYRNFARATVGRSESPRIRGFNIGDRTAVLYSREDLSVGLVGTPVDGIIGYDPDVASNLMMSILNYAGKLKK
ncbi:DUF4159 domain-containing protein [soil metagenome]